MNSEQGGLARQSRALCLITGRDVMEEEDQPYITVDPVTSRTLVSRIFFYKVSSHRRKKKREHTHVHSCSRMDCVTWGLNSGTVQHTG